MSAHQLLNTLSLLLSALSVALWTFQLLTLPPAKWPTAEKIRRTRNPLRHHQIVTYQATRMFAVSQLAELLRNPHLSQRHLRHLARKAANPGIRVLVAEHPNSTPPILHLLATGELSIELRDALLTNPRLSEGDTNFLALDQLATPERPPVSTWWAEPVLDGIADVAVA